MLREYPSERVARGVGYGDWVSHVLSWPGEICFGRRSTSSVMVSQGRRRCTMRWQLEQSRARSVTFVLVPGFRCEMGTVW